MSININWSKLTDITYWLEGIAGGSGTFAVTPANNKVEFFFWFWLGLFASFWLIGLVLKLFRTWLDEKHPLQDDWKIPFWSNNFIWMGILGDFWFFFRQSETVFLGARIWLIFGLVWFVGLIYLIVKYFLVNWKMENLYFQKEKSKMIKFSTK